MRPFRSATRPNVPAAPRPSAPVKSILRPSSTVLGWGRTSDDAALPSPEGSEAKRRKVFFDEVKNTTHEPRPRTADELKMEVRKTLEDHIGGKPSGAYDGLKELFVDDRRRNLSDSEDDEDDRPRPREELRDYVVALATCAPLLKDRSCTGLVKAILGSSWLGRDDDFSRIFIQFLASLVSAQGSYLGTVLGMMAEKFSLVKPSAWQAPDYAPVSREVMRDRLHMALQYLLQMFPPASDILAGVLAAKFPFANDTTRVHVAYVNNLLRIPKYAPMLETPVLDLVVHRLVRLDVQMQLDLDEVDEELGTSLLPHPEASSSSSSSSDNINWEDADFDDNDSDADSVQSDDSDYDAEAARIRSIRGSIEKLDAILDALFATYAPHFSDPDSDEAFEYYRILIDQFKNIILPTRNSRHTQFLVFHFGQMSDRLLDVLLGTCMTMAFQTTQPGVIRQAAILYLSSFVARGSRVPPSLARDVYSALLHQLDVYCNSHEPNCRGPELRRYYSYYTLFQGLIYAFCFRWKDLVVSAPESVDPEDPASYVGQDLEWLPDCKRVLLANVHSKMNPLKVCSPGIVDEFARLAFRLRFLYVFPRVQSNRQLQLSQYLSDTYGTGGALRDTGVLQLDEDAYQLDPWFPFDPYNLPTSKRWIEADYENWKQIPGLTVDEGAGAMEDYEGNGDEE